jgi:hypothetical protein
LGDWPLILKTQNPEDQVTFFIITYCHEKPANKHIKNAVPFKSELSVELVQLVYLISQQSHFSEKIIEV